MLEPFKVFSRDYKMTTVVIFLCNFSGVVISGLYCYCKWSELSLNSLTEALAIFIGMTRVSTYFVFFVVNQTTFVKLVAKIAKDRKDVVVDFVRVGLLVLNKFE